MLWDNGVVPDQLSMNVKIQKLNRLILQRFFVEQIDHMLLSLRRFIKRYKSFFIRWGVIEWDVLLRRVASHIRHGIGEQRHAQ